MNLSAFFSLCYELQYTLCSVLSFYETLKFTFDNSENQSGLGFIETSLHQTNEL